jgi:AAA15 family ATPase/GTPase
MQKLIDYKPLKKLSISGVENIECSGLIVIVGPNSSGKSQLLQDIYQKLCGVPREPIVAEKIEIDKPSDLNAFLKCLEKDGYINIKIENGVQTVKSKLINTLTGQYNEIQIKQVENWYANFENEMVNISSNGFMNYFGRLIFPDPSINNRTNSPVITTTNNMDFELQVPQNDLQSLYINDFAKEKLSSEIRNSFGRAVWPDATRGTIITLKISKDNEIPVADDRLSFQKMSNFRSIETEGDGMRSYISTCAHLLLGSRPVFIVDEPELCLHPPQAYNLGKVCTTPAAA